MGDLNDNRDASKPRTRWIVGCMTGTSLDGLDVALTEVRGSGLNMTAHFKGMVSLPLDDLSKQLRHFAEGNAAPPIDYMHAARQLGELHADAVAMVCKQHLPKDAKLDFVVAHGQTIWHAPGASEKNQGNNAGMSWQLFDPWPIVKRHRVPVCYDLRQADLIAGGQGAPITPSADWVMYRHPTRITTVLNLGGICNETNLSLEGLGSMEAMDRSPCNLMIDGVVQTLFPSQQFDRDGVIAARGKPDEFAFRFLMKHPRIREWDKAQKKPSMGREDFGQRWIHQLIGESPAQLSKDDIVASATKAVAQWIGCGGRVGRIVLAGGGVRNNTLLKMLREEMNHPNATIIVSDELGVPCEAREAMGFAVLGALSQDGMPITLPQVTGAKEPGVAGAWAGI